MGALPVSIVRGVETRFFFWGGGGERGEEGRTKLVVDLCGQNQKSEFVTRPDIRQDKFVTVKLL